MKVKAGDTHEVSWRANTDLAGASVRLIARDSTGPAIFLDAEVTDAAGGVVTHTLTGTLSPGTYRVELEVTRDGVIVTYPNDGYATLAVREDLG